MTLAWIYLIIAGLFEIGWPVGLKNGWGSNGVHLGWLSFAIICMGLSGMFLFFAQRTIPIGTAYAVWTGIGAVGTFAIGVMVFGDNLTALRMVSILLIICGVVGLKLA